MGYAISIGKASEEIWLIANRYVDWFYDGIFKGCGDLELREFAEISTYISGISFDNYNEEDEVNTKKLFELIKINLPNLIKRAINDGNQSLANHLIDLENMIKDYNIDG